VEELVVCGSCGRHVKVSESRCPFCAVPSRGRAVLAAAALGVGLSLAACGSNSAYGPPPYDGGLLDAAYGPPPWDGGLLDVAYGPPPYDGGPDADAGADADAAPDADAGG
jgi:hypothetical protein